MRTANAIALAIFILCRPQLLSGEPMLPENKPLDASFLRLYAETRGFMLGRPTKLKPTPDGKAVLFLRSEPKKAKLSLFEYEVATGKTKELLTPEAVLKGAEEHLSPEEKARRERMRISAAGFADFQLSEDGQRILLALSGKLYVYDRMAAKPVELSLGKGTLIDPKFSPDGSKVAYVLDHDVYVYDLASNRETPVTKGGNSKVTHGLAEFVAQEEMARFSGYWWSPDSKFIAYEEANHDGVEIWYVADPAKPDQKPQAQFYPRPGKKNVVVRLGVIPITGGDTVWVQWDAKKFEYLASVRWDKHGPLSIQVMDRKQQELLLLQVDHATGKTTTLLEERDSAFLNLHQSVPRWLPGNDGFLWISETSAGPELQWRDRDGKMTGRPFTPGPGIVQDVVGVDKSGRRFLYKEFDLLGKSTTSSDSTRSRIVELDLPKREGESWQVVSEKEGNSDATLSGDHSIYVISRTTHKTMPASRVFKSDPNELRPRLVGTIPSIAIEPGFEPSMTMEFIGPGPNGLFTTIVRPRNFDPKQKYPVIVDVYGGPHHLTVVDAMRPWLLMQWLADQGFIVVAVDNRGTPGRGRDWERSIYQKFGSVPIEDQIFGLKLLGSKYRELDLDRVGIVGWSFGGYMSALAVLKRPDIFKAAVAGAPVTDWEDYDSTYTERYMGLLPESKKAYEESSLLPLAAKLERPLLLVHGTADDNVYFRHTLRLTDALFRAGKDFEVLPLSGLTHMVPDPVVTERLWTRIAGHFQKHLGKPK